ncbi:MAG TPA: potassium-transporting ATPase subunit KdpA [Syntrophales bacterium]|nr:potassium-transporting ATPase subunit KdpA [Syntrophales bacterium]
MTTNGVLQALSYLAVLLILVKPLGSYMARVYSGGNLPPFRFLAPFERRLFRWCGVTPENEMAWKEYAGAVLLFSAAGWLLLFLVQRVQGFLPLNPQRLSAVAPTLAFNTAVSFVTNTNWQAYAGETAMSYLTQMLGLTAQNFLSAASGMAVLAAFVRGLKRNVSGTIGNFWTDLIRTVLYILLPLAVLLAVALVSQGVVQSLDPAVRIPLLQGTRDSAGKAVTEQIIPMGPAASQIAIKQIGTNGGGFFNANSAHPFENPTPITNALEMLAILLLPAALCYTFGRMVKDTRQGWAILAAMLLVFIPMLILCLWSEQAGNPVLSRLGVDQTAVAGQAGGNMEGKEVRFGIVNSALWAAATTAASNGSVNAMHDSFTPLGGLAPLWLIQLGEVVFGGVGSGLYGMLVFAVIAVFVAGLMVGRTPEYLGKKIEAFEMKMASLVILVPAATVLLGTAIAVVTKAGVDGISNPGPHGFTEILYAFSSAANNNGSAFAGLNASSVFYNLSLGIAMLVGRFWVMVPVLAMAGSLAKKKTVPPGPGTLPTHTPLFVILLAGVVLLVGALTFLPALALGPIVEFVSF